MSTVSSAERFCSKILLFGEYLVVKGGRGVAIPFSHFSGKLIKDKSTPVPPDKELKEFVQFLAHSSLLAKVIDIPRLSQDVEEGLHFDSNIPCGHGVGSSGALCAAILKTYQLPQALDSSDLGAMKDILSLMESYYHGVSSGLDPLISFLQAPVEIKNRNEFQLLQISQGQLLSKIYLVDTQISRKTAPLVHAFLELCQRKEFSSVLQEMIDTNEVLIQAFLSDDEEIFSKKFFHLSYLQYLWLDRMIPQDFKKFWLDGLESKKYLVKLCGAGGGGYLLVYAPDSQQMIGLPHIKIK